MGLIVCTPILAVANGGCNIQFPLDHSWLCHFVHVCSITTDEMLLFCPHFLSALENIMV